MKKKIELAESLISEIISVFQKGNHLECIDLILHSFCWYSEKFSNKTLKDLVRLLAPIGNKLKEYRGFKYQIESLKIDEKGTTNDKNCSE